MNHDNQRLDAEDEEMDEVTQALIQEDVVGKRQLYKNPVRRSYCRGFVWLTQEATSQILAGTCQQVCYTDSLKIIWNTPSVTDCLT